MTVLRTLGSSDIRVSPVAFGGWPIAGMTSLDVNDADSRKTLDAALECNVSFWDTAYGYGLQGESERLMGRAIQGRREQVVIATKCGLEWDAQSQQALDGRPVTLRRHIDVSLDRLQTDYVEVLYLHAPDPNTPITESAGALREIQQSGKALLIGVSNFDVHQLEAFHAICPIAVVQPPYNMLQRQIEKDVIPWCLARRVSIAVYWPLMKGLLAGKLSRSHVFPPNDGRGKYPMFQGEQWQKNQDFVEELRTIACEVDATVAQLAVRWVLEQSGITAALCGAKRAYQIEEVAGAMQLDFDSDLQAKIAAALARRGEADTQPAV